MTIIQSQNLKIDAYLSFKKSIIASIDEDQKDLERTIEFFFKEAVLANKEEIEKKAKELINTGINKPIETYLKNVPGRCQSIYEAEEEVRKHIAYMENVIHHLSLYEPEEKEKWAYNVALIYKSIEFIDSRITTNYYEVALQGGDKEEEEKLASKFKALILGLYGYTKRRAKEQLMQEKLWENMMEWIIIELQSKFPKMQDIERYNKFKEEFLPVEGKVEKKDKKVFFDFIVFLHAKYYELAVPLYYFYDLAVDIRIDPQFPGLEATESLLKDHAKDFIKIIEYLDFQRYDTYQIKNICSKAFKIVTAIAILKRYIKMPFWIQYFGLECFSKQIKQNTPKDPESKQFLVKFDNKWQKQWLVLLANFFSKKIFEKNNNLILENHTALKRYVEFFQETFLEKSSNTGDMDIWASIIKPLSKATYYLCRGKKLEFICYLARKIRFMSPRYEKESSEAQQQKQKIDNLFGSILGIKFLEQQAKSFDESIQYAKKAGLIYSKYNGFFIPNAANKNIGKLWKASIEDDTRVADNSQENDPINIKFNS